MRRLVYRAKLLRRLTKLERKLKVPPEERHICTASLDKAEDIFIEGTRIWQSAASLCLDSTGRVVKPTMPLPTSAEAPNLRWTPESLGAQKVDTVPKAAKEVRNVFLLFQRDN